MGLEACFWMDNKKSRQVYAPLPALLGCVVVDCVILCFFDSLLLFCYQVFKCFVLPYIRIWFRYSVVFWCVARLKQSLKTMILSLPWFECLWFLL